jgi:hypothetical protein
MCALNHCDTILNINEAIRFHAKIINNKGVFMKILAGLSATFDSITKVIISLLGLAIVLSLLGGNVPFVGGVAQNIIGLVQSLGDAGIVGLVAAIIILGFYK